LLIALMGSATPIAGAGSGLVHPGPGGGMASSGDGVGGIERQLESQAGGSGNTGTPRNWSSRLPTPPSVNLCSGGWLDMGHSLAGLSERAPSLSLLAHDSDPDLGALWISGGEAHGTGWLVVGRSSLLRPFHDGVMVPAMDVLLPITLDARGQAVFPMLSDPGSAPLVIFGQAWFPGASGLQSLSASNGVALLPL